MSETWTYRKITIDEQEVLNLKEENQYLSGLVNEYQDEAMDRLQKVADVNIQLLDMKEEYTALQEIHDEAMFHLQQVAEVNVGLLDMLDDYKKTQAKLWSTIYICFVIIFLMGMFK